MVLVAVLTLGFTSCDDDDDYIADTLEGTWRGNMQVTSRHNDVTRTATYSEICFVGDPYTFSSGTGYWVDYYSNYAGDYVANHITWTVRNRVIFVHFVEEDTDLEIHDYRLNDGYFQGTIYYRNKRVYFSLEHISSPNWYGFDYDGFDDSYWGYYGYAKGATTTRATDSATVTKPVRTFGTNHK